MPWIRFIAFRVTGVVVFYSAMQINIWWVLHAIALFLSIQFPYWTRRLRKSKKIVYIHVACVAAGLLFPLVPVIAAMAEHSANPGKLAAVVAIKI